MATHTVHDGRGKRTIVISALGISGSTLGRFCSAHMEDVRRAADAHERGGRGVVGRPSKMVEAVVQEVNGA